MKAALYARFSTEKQRDASIDDQFRECERVAKAAGLEIVARFEDRGISGGTHTRPGYQALLAAARAHEFDIMVTEDISRLWRNRAEFGPRSAELEDLGVHCLTCVGDDTRRDGWGLVIQIKQAVAEHARREASYRTRRGLEGNALAGKSTGGRAYGYVPARGGQIEIDATEAPIVRRIFEMYAAGASPRGIAATFNAEGIPSPGAGWKRSARRQDGKWLASAIHGDVNRGTGILNNRRYIGITLWGRSEWKRSAADSKKRRHKMLEGGAAHETVNERLRIVPQELWDRAKARQALRSKEVGAKVKGVLRQRVRPTKYLLSGLLRCQACESSFALSNAKRYQCSSHHEGGDHACAVSLSVPRDRIESVMLDCAHKELLDPAKLAELEAWQVAHRSAVIDYRPRIVELEKQIANFVKAIGEGSAAVSAALKAAEAELGRLKGIASLPHTAQQKTSREPVEKRAARIRERLAAGGEFAQAAMRELFPDSIWLERDPSGRFLWARAMGAWPAWDSRHYDSDGVALSGAFPTIYRAGMGQVDVSGSGGRI